MARGARYCKIVCGKLYKLDLLSQLSINLKRLQFFMFMSLSFRSKLFLCIGCFETSGRPGSDFLASNFHYQTKKWQLLFLTQELFLNNCTTPYLVKNRKTSYAYSPPHSRKCIVEQMKYPTLGYSMYHRVCSVT